MSFQRACAIGEVEDAKPLAVTVDGIDVAVVRNGEDFYAIYDECSHAAIPLSEGDVECRDGGCFIECWLHGSTFDLRTGKPTTLPAFEPVAIYPVKIDGEDLLVNVDSPITEGPITQGPITEGQT